MNSNGTFLLERVGEILDSRLTLLNVSLDGAVSKSCHSYGEDHPFSEVVRGVRQLRAEKEKRNCSYPKIRGQFIVTIDTVDEVEALKAWALGIGAEDVNFKRQHQTMPGEKERSEVYSGTDPMAIVSTGKVVSAEKLNWSPVDCSHPWDSIFLSCTGEVGICSFDPYLSVKGLKGGQDLASLWNGDAIKRVRRWHSGADAQIQPPCSKCNRLPGYLALRGRAS